jgi:NADPH2:quinone reductase
MKYRRIIVNRKRQLEPVEGDLPNPRRGEERVKILAAGVSFADVLMREGVHAEARRPPFTLGWDVVGCTPGQRCTGFTRRRRKSMAHVRNYWR